MARGGTKTYERDPFGRAISSGTTNYLFDGAEVVRSKKGTTSS